MTSWNIVIYVCCGALLAVLLWKETSRANRHILWARLFACVLVAAAIACLALPIKVKRQLPAGSRDVILLTQGYVRDSVQKVLDNLPIAPPVYSTEKSLAGSNNLGAVYAPDPALVVPANTNVHVFGYGFNEGEYERLKNNPILFHPSTISGVQSITWNKELSEGEPLFVSGKYLNESRNVIKLQLAAFGKTVDSIFLKPGSGRDFQFRSIPKVLGRSVLNLVAVSGADTLQSEPIPVVVSAREKFRVMILTSSPDFESKFLKNWLGHQGYEVVLISTTSKNKSQSTFVNTGESGSVESTDRALQKTGVLIIDAPAFNGLGGALQGKVTRLVAGGSLGVVFQTDSSVAKSSLSSSFALSRVALREHAITPLWSDTTLKVPAIQSDFVASLRPRAGNQAIVSAIGNHVLSAVSMYGRGRVVYATLPGTFSWMLAGNHDAYSSYWTTILNAAIAKKNEAESWSTETVFPVVDQPVGIVLKTAGSATPTGIVGDEQLSLVQDAPLRDRWTGTYWPRRNGWLSITQSDGTNKWLYVFNDVNWRTARAHAQTAFTLSRIRANKNLATATIHAELVMVPVKKFYFLLVLIIALAFLWIEEKFYDKSQQA